MKNDNDLSKWYYSIELQKGIFTKGNNFPNVVLTRKILKNIEVKNKCCLDIGSMEGLIPTLLKRRGARQVFAYDRRADLSDKINIVKKAYDVDFHLIAGMSLNKLPEELKKKNPPPLILSYFRESSIICLIPLEGLPQSGDY